MTIRIKHPIIHDGIHYGRGEYDVPEDISAELAAKFVSLTSRGEPRGYAAEVVTERESGKGKKTLMSASGPGINPVFPR